MPQESLRSVVYRSFVTCEDPRGVVEGKTIKLSKTDTTKMSSQSKNSKEKEKMSSYQLVEVKNGARKLNETIDSWSKGVSFKGQPKDIAKDLLKGALDLQESLMMLGRLQEASCMAKFKKKPEKTSEVLVSKTKIGSDRFESFRNRDMGNKNQRNLVDGSSRDCYSELRDVIRDGLSKQNLLQHKSYQESVSTRNEGLTGRRTDIASTSSSRSSSMVYSTHEFTSSESFTSRATEEKSKGTNLIAKLMGLEDFPSKPVVPTPRTQLDRNWMNPIFDVDLPNAKKPQFFVRKLDREHMTLDEIIDMMQSKGILRSNKETSRRFRDDDAPPIVLMKPQRLVPDNQKVKANENRIRKLHQEKAKSEDKSIKIKGNLSANNKHKASVPVVTKPGRKQEMEKKIDKIQKMVPPVKRKPIENVKSTNSVSESASLKPKQTSSSVSVSCTNKSSNQRKNRNLKTENPVDEPLSTIVHEVLQIDSPNENKTQDCEATIREIDNVRQQFLCEAFEEGSDSVYDAVTGNDQSETRNNHEESDVFIVKDRKDRILETISNFQDYEAANFELFQDCVNEFLEHENRRQNPWQLQLPSRFCISEDELMMEVVKGIENVRSYSKLWKERCNADSVCGFLERDMCWSRMGGSWSSGWKHGYSVNEVEEVVLDLEKMVLSRLIDDVVMELVP